MNDADNKREREQFSFFYSYKDAINELETNERLQMYEAITDFMFFSVEPNFESIALRAVWKCLIPNLRATKNISKARSEANAARKNHSNQYTTSVQQNATSVQQNATSVQQNATSVQQNATNKNKNKKEKENIKENPYFIGVKEKSLTRFSPPKKEEIIAYMVEMGVIDAEETANAFNDHHCARGWVLSNGRTMKDWRAAVRMWIRNANKFNVTKASSKKGATEAQTLVSMAQMMQEETDNIDLFGGWKDPTKR